MNDLSTVEYNIYYKLRTLCQNHNVLLGDMEVDRLSGNTIFLVRSSIVQEPFQLGVGLRRYVSFTINVLSTNGVIHSDNVSTILDTFESNGMTVWDYSPIDGVSNFPFAPPESSTQNENYSEVEYGWMEFSDAVATDLLEEVRDKVAHSRTVIEFNVSYEKI